MPAILLTAVYFGIGPSVTAAVLAVIQYDFFLLPPVHTFVIGRFEDLVAFGIFFLVAILTGQLAGQARQRATSAQRRARESTTLYELGQALMSTHDVEEVLHAITERIVEVFGVDRCAIFVPGAGNELRLAAETVRGSRRNRAAQSTAAWAFRHGTEMTLPADSASRDSQRLYVPLRTANQVVGVMEVGLKRSGAPLETEERLLVSSFAAQASLVISRAQSEQERRRLQLIEDSDRLKSSLVNAVSHDFRTPLASIKASATALLMSDSTWTTEEGRELLHAIDHEADRLNRLVGNLLDLSRIEAGVLRPVLEWYDVREIVERIQRQAGPLLETQHFGIDVRGEIPPVQVDLLRVEELLVNLLENAARYSPAGAGVELQLCHTGSELVLTVADHGPGIPEAQRERIFDAFFQGQPSGDRQPGAGLGLAICRGVAEAHGGSIEVQETPGGGATFIVRLPTGVLHEPVPA